jgi:Kef-type K+ transport system membrane component KefB
MTFLHTSLFTLLAGLTLCAAITGIVAHRARQPLILAFIFVGLLAGPDALGLIGRDGVMPLETLAEMGIVLLLFMVGLRLDPGTILAVGSTSAIAGVLQVALTAAAGMGLCHMLGFGTRESLFLGFALSFSSTIIVVKLLTDKRALDSLYGRLTLGILIMQDIIVILATVLLSALGDAARDGLWRIVAEFALLAIMTAGFVRFLSKPLTRLLAHSSELTVLFAMGFAGVAAAACAAMGLSRELGGLLAGMALAGTPIKHVISARLTGLRDFLLLFFFLSLGAHMNLHGIGRQEGVALVVLSGFVLLGKPAIVHSILLVFGYRPRTGFLTGVALGQISEFSLILAAIGVAKGYIGREGADLMIGLALVTITLSTGMIMQDAYLFRIWEKFFSRWLTTEGVAIERTDERTVRDADIVLVGLGRYGLALAHEFRRRGFSVMGVDFDPEAVRSASDAGWPALYGDASDPDFAEHLPLRHTKAVIFSFYHTQAGPLMTDLRRTLADNLREAGYRGHIATTSHHAKHDRDLTQHGIDIILQPFEDAAFHAVEKIQAVISVTQKTVV